MLGGASGGGLVLSAMAAAQRRRDERSETKERKEKSSVRWTTVNAQPTRWESDDAGAAASERVGHSVAASSSSGSNDRVGWRVRARDKRVDWRL